MDIFHNSLVLSGLWAKECTTKKWQHNPLPHHIYTLNTAHNVQWGYTRLWSSMMNKATRIRRPGDQPQTGAWGARSSVCVCEQLTWAAQMLSRSCRVRAFSLMTKRRIFSSFSTYWGWCRLSRSTMDRMLFCWIHSCNNNNNNTHTHSEWEAERGENKRGRERASQRELC